MYFAALLAMLIPVILLKKTHVSSKLIIYIELTIIYAFATGLSLAVVTERATFILIIMPLLAVAIFDRVDRFTLFNLAFVVVYSVFMYIYKADRLINIEIFSIIISFIMSMLANYKIQSYNLHGMLTDIENTSLVEQLLRSEQEMQIDAEIDGLTGLLNRSTLVRYVQIALQSERKGVSALCIIDLDFFKQINDDFGHQCGDDVLVAVAQIIKKEFRTSDIVGRLGGDEFMIYLSEFTDELQLYERVASLHHRLNVTSINGLSSISASIGVVLVPGYVITFDDLYKLADKALYNAKDNGRNQVSFAGIDDL